MIHSAPGSASPNTVDDVQVKWDIKITLDPSLTGADKLAAQTEADAAVAAKKAWVMGYVDTKTGKTYTTAMEQAKADLLNSMTGKPNVNNAGADGMIEASGDEREKTLNWLNAYNTPHWMNIGAQMEYQGSREAPTKNNSSTIKGWDNSQNGWSNTAVETYGTSWTRDLIAAVGIAANSQLPGSQYNSTYTYLFNAGVDANWGYSTRWTIQDTSGHKTHDLGVSFDLGISNLVIPDKQTAEFDNLTLNKDELAIDLLDPAHPEKGTRLFNMPDIQAYNENRWSLANAIYLSGLLTGDIDNNQKAALHEFLSLYALTQGDSITGNGTWDDLPVKNGAAVRAALFGSGAQPGGLIPAVHIGGIGGFSSYKDIREILNRLGIVATAVDPHQHHFHIYLKPPAPLDITANLMAGQANAGVTDDQIAAQQQAVQTLLDYAPTLITGEELMITMEVPYIPPQEAPIVLVQAADISKQPDYMLKTCTESTSGGGGTWVSPTASLVGAVLRQERRQVSAEEGSALEATVKLTQLQGVAHGQLIPQSADGTPGGRVVYKYRSVPGYLGKDQAIFLAEYQGKRYRIVVNIIVSVGIDDNNPQCPPPFWKLIKITQPSSGFNGYDLNSITVTFANLAGGAVGEATGNTITLDDNAAGHNWFIDSTPWDNSEYLPTSNPNEWVAKAGSEAADKMDMLSVLLHEYGHALGIEHSPDNHDYMATTLTPGVRRMPSAEEMALMQQLVGQVKEEMVASSPSWFDGLTTNGSGNAPSPIPLPLPLGGFGLAFLGRLRSSRYGDLSIAPDYATLTTKYAVAANATFANLDTPAGWNSQGSVDIVPSGSGTSTGSGRTVVSSATLNEISTSQTRLSQIFMLGEQDRYLSFTLSGAALDDLNGAPDDAFEVALLDANTGLSVLGGNGLTRTDSFLNLQADGTQHVSDCVTCTWNSDGSRTYRVDLSGVAKNTAVNLSFDLLGFGQDNSHVTLSDIRVSGLPQLHDDAATLLEDNLLTFDPFAQADAQLKPLLGAHIVDAPTHGVLAVNVDGTFAYTPDLDYFGADSFSYRLSDGPLDSNLATVSLSVTPVNDAPVVADVQATTAEDTPLVIVLGVYASDVDSTTLATQIVTGPAHGSLTQNADGSYTYTPDANYNGADSFTYRVNDGALDSNIATVTLAITPVNDAPVAADTQAATDEDTPLNLNLLAAASDVDGDVLTPAIIAGPLHGQLVSNADGTFNYVSDLNYFGTDSFTYKVNDAALDSNIVTVSLTIAAVNDAPVAVSAAVTGPEDTPYIFNWSDFKVSDVDSVDLAITINTLPLDGLMQYYDGLIWLEVIAGQRIVKADIDAGFLCFGPDANESGFDGYSTTGAGNLMQDYASFTYQADDGSLSSAVASMTINITPVADTPSLVLTAPVDAYGATAMLFSTSWESASNRSPTSTVLPQYELEGWHAITPAGDPNNHFIVWSSGDKMKDANNTNRIVNAAPNDGNNWIELTNAQGNGHETWGIERTVDTRAGVTYNLSLDYAGRLGYGIDYTCIGIYVDGVRIATHAGTSSNTALNWEALNFSFTGTGATQTIRIVTEATSSQCNGRGAMIDNIALTEYMPINTGYQDSPIRLSAVVAELIDTDGSEVIGVTVGAIPTGAIITDGTHSYTATDSLHIVVVTDWNLANLSITAPADFTGTFALTVAASASEMATGEIANYAVSLPVTVVPTNVTSPLVIDLNGDGVRTTALDDFIGSFDLLNSGKAIGSGWLSAEDGFLAIDSNGNGRIDDRSELFGGSLGEGYAKLAGFDSNRDGVVNARDARYRELNIWQDANGNHRTDAGELHGLADFGINGMNVNHTIAPEVQNGNWLIERGKVTFKDGHTAEMADAYFEIDPLTRRQSNSTTVRAEPPEVSKGEAHGATRANSSTITLRSELQQPQILGIPLGAKSVEEKLGPAAALMFAERQVRAPAVIDWSAQTNQRAASGNRADSDDAKKKRKGKTNWLADFLGVTRPAVNLAESTGLNVTMPTVEEPKQAFVESSQRRSRESDASTPTSER